MMMILIYINICQCRFPLKVEKQEARNKHKEAVEKIKEEAQSR